MVSDAPWLVHISGFRMKDFEIRVGLNGTDLGNSAVCYKQLESMTEGATVKFKCREELYGSWVSVNKTTTTRDHEYLQLLEVRVYGSEYRSLVIYVLK